MKNTAHTHILGSGGRLVAGLLVAFLIAVALSSCAGAEAETGDLAQGEPTATPAANGLPLLTVERIEPGIDGYTAYLTDSIGGAYTAVISIPNLEDAFVSLEVGDRVTIAGDYAESSPVQILNITDITVVLDQPAAQTS